MVRKPDPIDPETGVWNQVWVYDRANGEWNRSDRYDQVLAAIEVEVLEPAEPGTMRKVAEVLRDTLRAYDVIGRKGPTTFTVVACEIRSTSVRRICERIKDGANEKGIALACGAVTNKASRVEIVEDLFDVAWEACSRAQRGEGSNGICVVE